MTMRKKLLEELVAEIEAAQKAQTSDIGKDIDFLEEYVDGELRLMLDEMKRLKERIIAFNNVKKEFDQDPFTAAGDLEELTRGEKNEKLKLALQKVFKHLG